MSVCIGDLEILRYLHVRLIGYCLSLSQGSEKTIGNEEGEEEDREERETVNESTNGFSGIQLQSVQVYMYTYNLCHNQKKSMPLE